MEEITIYTDGACSGNPGPGGWGAILMFGDTKKEISGGLDNTTNNVMELTAVIESLKILKRPCKVDLYSDSAYVVNAFLQKWIYGWIKKNWKTAGNDPVKIKNFGKNYMVLPKFMMLLFIKLKVMLTMNLIIDVTSLQEWRGISFKVFYYSSSSLPSSVSSYSNS